MTEIQFYHLLTTPLERALPKLMEKALSANMRCVIRVDSEAMMNRLNDVLWTYQERSFLPHGSVKDKHAEQQPIYITYRDENPNSATLLVITDGSQLENPEPYAKVLDIFNGHDDAAVSNARSRWKHYQSTDHKLTYIKQQDGGGWKNMAAA